MKKKVILISAISVIIMLALPWLATAFLDSDTGMMACMLLFFAINPIFSVIVGAFAGKNIKCLWSLPIIVPILFLLGAWIFFAMGEVGFILYAIIYLVFGLVSMLISMLINKK